MGVKFLHPNSIFGHSKDLYTALVFLLFDSYLNKSNLRYWLSDICVCHRFFVPLHIIRWKMSANYNLFYFFKQFPDEDACRKYLEKRRWGKTPVCPHCGSAQKVYRYKNGKTFKCAHCKKQFSVKTGTIYENSNIPLQKWFLAFYLISLSKKGISSIELSKAIGVTQKTAWYLLHKISYMLEHRNSDN